MDNKIKMTKQEFDKFYEITGEIEDTPIPEPEIPDKQDTTPEFLTEEEEVFDVLMHKDLPQEEQE